MKTKPQPTPSLPETAGDFAERVSHSMMNSGQSYQYIRFLTTVFACHMDGLVLHHSGHFDLDVLTAILLNFDLTIVQAPGHDDYFIVQHAFSELTGRYWLPRNGAEALLQQAGEALQELHETLMVHTLKLAHRLQQESSALPAADRQAAHAHISAMVREVLTRLPK